MSHCEPVLLHQSTPLNEVGNQPSDCIQTAEMISGWLLLLDRGHSQAHERGGHERNIQIAWDKMENTKDRLVSTLNLRQAMIVFWRLPVDKRLVNHAQCNVG